MNEDPKRIAIIDGDGLAFHSLRETLEQSLEALDDKFQNLLTKTQADHYLLFISKGKYFRHDVFPEYKIKRREYTKDRVSYVRTLKSVLQDKYGAEYTKGVEADDLCAFYYKKLTTELYGTAVLCSPDKDLLTCIPNKCEAGHFNYTYKIQGESEPTIKGWWIETTAEQAEWNFWASMITGDSSDGIPGIFRKGIKYVNKLFEGKKIEELPNIVFNTFIEAYGMSKGIFEFQKHYRLLHLLDCQEDYLRETGEIPGLVFPIPVPTFESNSFNPTPSTSSEFLNDDNL